ncbi:hypothetical protein AB0K43_05460 [Kitasatospora sp. NPDC049258]|uniref:hypothetical protein n=1 Tax=Kitasatospora sp. NPDC049258 TaxID=3155394 RepID=UPI003424D427
MKRMFAYLLVAAVFGALAQTASGPATAVAPGSVRAGLGPAGWGRVGLGPTDPSDQRCEGIVPVTTAWGDCHRPHYS